MDLSSGTSTLTIPLREPHNLSNFFRQGSRECRDASSPIPLLITYVPHHVKLKAEPAEQEH